MCTIKDAEKYLKKQFKINFDEALFEDTINFKLVIMATLAFDAGNVKWSDNVISFIDCFFKTTKKDYTSLQLFYQERIIEFADKNIACVKIERKRGRPRKVKI